ncbi:MAG: MFS transporter [Leucobacter sp.]
MSTRSRGSVRQWLALVVLTLTVFMLAVDGTVLALAVPALTADLGATATQVLWIGDIYSFAIAGLLVTMGNIADRIGRKKLLLLGSIGFGIASALAAFSTSAEILIAARALLGVFGATLMPSTLAIVRNVFEDPAQRTRAIAIWSAGATAGAAAGPLVGGLLLEHFGWGSVFLINVPVVIIVLVTGIFLLPESFNSERPRIDLLSAVLSITTIVPVVYAIKHLVGTGFDWTVPVTLFIGVASGWIFVRRQRRLDTPLIDLELFRIPAFSGAVGANALAIFAFVGLLFFLSQYLQLVRGLSPLQAGLAELPSAIASAAVILIITLSLRWFGLGRAIGVGLFTAALGLGFLAVAESLPGLIWVIVALTVVGFGAGLAMTLSTDAVVSAAPRSRAGAAASISETAYELGVAMGIAVLGSLHTAFYRANLPSLDGIAEPAASAIQDSLAVGSAVVGESDPALLAAAQHAFTSGMQITAVIAALLLAISAVIAWRVIPSQRNTVATQVDSH